VFLVVPRNLIVGGLGHRREALRHIGLDPQGIPQVAAQLIARHRRLGQNRLECGRIRETPLNLGYSRLDGGRRRFGRRVSFDLGQYEPSIDQAFEHRLDRVVRDVRRHETEVQCRLHIRQRDDVAVNHGKHTIDDRAALALASRSLHVRTCTSETNEHARDDRGVTHHVQQVLAAARASECLTEAEVENAPRFEAPA
jgi:hypothetical protein